MQDYGVEVPEGDYSADEVKYNSALGRFVRDSVNGVLFHWPGDERWNDPATGLAHTDRLYHRSHPTWGDAYFTLEMNPDGTLNPEPVEYDIAPEKAGRPLKQVIFAHRSELFDPDGPLLVVEDAVDPEFSIDASIIYSTVEIGYAQEKSDNVNGREEFNGTHVYTTGITVTDHTLTLKSKYRADTYGIEFAAQKRGEDTTDSEVDEDVFFVLCQEISGAFYPDRSTDIVGTISPDAFNADFSPLACVEANKGYIGMMSQSVVLRFASSTGNSDVTIGGTPMTDDIHISSPLMTAGLVSFSTMSASSIKSAGMIGVESGGMRYVGFLKEIEEPYARGSQKDCTIFVKTIEKC